MQFMTSHKEPDSPPQGMVGRASQHNTARRFLQGDKKEEKKKSTDFLIAQTGPEVRKRPPSEVGVCS